MTTVSDHTLREIIRDLTRELKSRRDEALEQASSILGRDVQVQSLHGLICGKNNTYVNCVEMEFFDFDDFFERWLRGLCDKAEKGAKSDYGMSGSCFRVISLLNNPIIYEYARKILEKNYYKNIRARQRLKPSESLWEIWFGNRLIYGLLIAPEWNESDWRIDKSEIRRAT